VIYANVNLLDENTHCNENTGALVIGLMKVVARFEFLTVMLQKSHVVWEVALCHFEGL
jgi:hypothetical protein